MYRKVLCTRGGYHNFLLEIVCLTVLKNIVGEHFGESEKIYIEKFYRMGDGGSIKIFRREVLVPKYRQILLGNRSVYQKVSGIEKIYS